MKYFKYKSITIQFDEKNILKYVEKHLRHKDCETGGIICGYYTDDLSQATITEFCEPPKDSIFGRSTFSRGVVGTEKYLKEKWNKGQYYLGDWHLHPYSSPIASFQDLNQLEINSNDKQLKCPEPLMVIVGGSSNKDFNVYIFIESEAKLCQHLDKSIQDNH